MASHQLAIAKASFSAGLLRPDPTPLSREDIAHFHTLLSSVVLQCSPKNVQKCKQWILKNIVQSTARFTALGKFLASLAASFAVSDRPKENTIKREPSIKRKRLHLLYLLNDILYYTKYRVNDASICSKIQPMLVGLLGSAASFKGCPKHQRKIQELLDLWQDNSYYSREYVDKLRETVRNAADAGQYIESVAMAEKEEGSITRVAKSAPYVMPAMHGDASTPWFDLPAGNLMPHIIPNSTRPINPDLIKPLKFVAGPADDTLVLAVKDLLDDVDTIYGKEVDQEGRSYWDIDELGQPIMLDEITGEVISGEGYYGWSRSFCEKMRRRKKGLDMVTDKHFRRSPSRSSSPEGRKRRYSADNASSEDGFRSRRQRRSYSSSRSPTPDRGRRNVHSRTRSRSSSRSPLPSSRSPERSGQFQRDSRPAPPPPDNLPPRPPIPSIPPPPFQQGFNPNFPRPPPPLHNMPFNPQGQQFGVWPPPPPPPPTIQNIHFNPQNPPIGAWAPPPPPPPGPPPMDYQQQQQQYGGYPPSGPGGWQQTNGRGNYNGGGWNNGRGRGGYRGGRGW